MTEHTGGNHSMICIIGSETTKNYGLFHDLSHSSEFKVFYAKPMFMWWPFARRVYRRIRRQFFHKNEHQAVWERSFLKQLDQLDRIIIVDTALRWLELRFLNQCRDLKPGLIIDCLLLNSTQSMTFSEKWVDSIFRSFHWDSILTFDPVDAKNNNWEYIGFHYYSKHPVRSTRNLDSDLFFAGSIMGPRGKTLLQLLYCFNEKGVNCKYICPSPDGKLNHPNQPKGLQLIRRRIPYKHILNKMMGSNCILEVLQEGQYAPSLRYFEAVCYNKKLLTTNTEIKKYPYYDERFMKVFSQESDIDYEWVKRPEHIDYGYQNEFSPMHLFDTRTQMQ